MIKYIGIGIAGLALVGCTQAAPTPVVTVTAPASPAPTVTVEPEEPSYDSALDYAWSTLSASEKQDVCILYNLAPGEAWDAFNQGSEGAIPHSEFDQFFSMKCSAY